MNSPGHRANILNKDCTRVGVGTYVDDDGLCWWVQMFSRNAPDAPYYGEDDGDNNGGSDGGGEGTDPGDGKVIGNRIPVDTITTGLSRVWANGDGVFIDVTDRPYYANVTYLGTARIDLEHPEADGEYVTLTFPVPASFEIKKDAKDVAVFASSKSGNAINCSTSAPKDDWIRVKIGPVRDFFSKGDLDIYRTGIQGPPPPGSQTGSYETSGGGCSSGSFMFSLVSIGIVLFKMRRNVG